MDGLPGSSLGSYDGAAEYAGGPDGVMGRTMVVAGSETRKERNVYEECLWSEVLTDCAGRKYTNNDRLSFSQRKE